MEKTYSPQAIETQWYKTWEDNNYFVPAGEGPSYCIMLPPPNVTGSLHMGHAFQQTLMDVLIRYHRMQGDKTLWQCGTDHAGIATQMVVERQLEAKGNSRHDLGRESFTEAVWEWKETSGNTITKQSRRLGTSMDWSRERFTLDEGLSKAVNEVFVRLYEEGLIERYKSLNNWDPVLHTAISDLEVISEEEDGYLWHMRYPRKDGNGYVVVATTRPETMLGDAAVAVHPDDERYQDLVGKEVELPLTGRTIPVIADAYADPEFGSGCVKITPAHDRNDYAAWFRNQVIIPQFRKMPNEGLINIFTIDARINENGPEAYQGLDRFEARKQIVADLEAQDLIEKIEPYRHVIPRGDRSHAVIEPYLTDQWFVKVKSLADPAIAAVEKGDIRFVPDNWSKTYFEWMRNIEDWCISRQLWWGHRIPAWYDETGNIYVGRDEASIRQINHIDDSTSLVQDPDVLDTWFSSALWPFSTLGWPEETKELKTFYPSSVLVTGFDIIFFWVARMIMMGLKLMDDVPFKEVYIHGLVRDADGQKMSKSKGNILDPLDLIDGIDLESLVEKRTQGLMQPKLAPKIEKATRQHFPDGIEAYGTDSLRFTFAALATQGRGINFDVGRIQGYRNFCNKLWNATRYVLINVEGQTLDINNGKIELGLAERWINTRMAQAIDQVTEGIHTYRFDLAAQALYEFTWDEYCDWYLELSKTTLTDQDASEAIRRGTLQTLISNLEILLRLMHPFMPFITEELWQKVAPIINKQTATIMLQTYPNADELDKDETSLNEIEWVKTFILGVRRIKAERDIAPGKTLAVKIKGGNPKEKEWLKHNNQYLKTLGKIESITEIETEPDDAVVALAGDMTLLVPLANLIDLNEELARLKKEISKLKNEKELIEKKLGNEKFITRAPEQVVNKERERLSVITTTSGTLEEQYKRISYVKGNK